MIKARPKYPTDLYGTIYIDNIQKAVVICLIIPIMIKARPRYPTNLYGTIYIDNTEKAVVICLIIPTIFPVDT
jgi:hypothetical protein